MPPPTSGALHLPMPSWTPRPHLPAGSCGRPRTEESGRKWQAVNPACRYLRLIDEPCSELWVQVFWEETGQPSPRLGSETNSCVLTTSMQRRNTKVDGKHAQELCDLGPTHHHLCAQFLLCKRNLQGMWSWAKPPRRLILPTPCSGNFLPCNR